MSKTTSVWFHFSGEVTLWLEGARPEEDYHPAYHRLRQKDALAILDRCGFTSRCHVTTVNTRNVDGDVSLVETRARRFAEKAGIPFRLSVVFPQRATRDEAAQDLVTFAPIVQELATQGCTCELYCYGGKDGWKVVVRTPLDS